MSNFIKQWTHKEVEVLTRSFRRYSFYVIILKFVLPLTALAMAGILFVYPMVTGKSKKIVLVAQDKVVQSTESPVMAKPKFVGVDSKNQPYQLTADKAVQTSPEFTKLDKINGDMTLNSGAWIACVAKRGDYDSTKHFINLYDAVSFYMMQPDDTAYQAQTTRAAIDMETGTMKGEEPVSVTSDGGTLHADKFLIEREKQKITFQGNVKLVIFKK